MQIGLAFVLILSFSFAHAKSELHSFIDLPTYIDKAINSNFQQRRACVIGEETEASTASNPYQECLELVCGNPNSFTSTFDQWYNESDKVSGEETAVIKQTPMGKTLTEKIEEYYKEDPHRIGDEEKKKQVLEMAKNPLENMMFLVHGPSGYLIAYEGFGVFKHGEYNEVTSLYEIKDSFFEGVSAAKKERFKKLKEQVELNINSSEQQYRYISTQEFIKEKYPDHNFKSGVLKYLDELGKIELKYLKNIGGLMPFPIDLVSSRNSIKNNDISSVELDLLIQDSATVEYINYIFDYQDMYGEEISKEIESKLKSWFKDKDSAKLISLIEAKILKSEEEEKEEDKKREKEKEKSLEICLDSYHRNSILFPNHQSIKSLESTVKSAKRKFIEKVLRLDGLSSKSKNHLKSRLEKLRFKLPYSKDTYKEVLISSIDKMILNNKKTKEAFKTKLDMKSLFTHVAYSVAFPNEIDAQEEEDDEENFDGDVAEVCQSLEQKAFSDATYTAFGEILLSYTLAKGPKHYQEQVIFHELGHNLERILRREISISEATSKAFEVTKECLGDIQKAVIGDENHTEYFSEDFADWIAYKVEDGFNKPLSCEYLRFEKGTGFYKEKSIYNELENDNHSSKIFRILRYLVDKNRKIPKECSDPLVNEGVLLLEKQCSL